MTLLAFGAPGGAELCVILLPLAIVVSVAVVAWRAYANRGAACPSCAERIKVEAKVCRHCGRDVRG